MVLVLIHDLRYCQILFVYSGDDNTEATPKIRKTSKLRYTKLQRTSRLRFPYSSTEISSQLTTSIRIPHRRVDPLEPAQLKYVPLGGGEHRLAVRQLDPASDHISQRVARRRKTRFSIRIEVSRRITRDKPRALQENIKGATASIRVLRSRDRTRRSSNDRSAERVVHVEKEAGDVLTCLSCRTSTLWPHIAQSAFISSEV